MEYQGCIDNQSASQKTKNFKLAEVCSVPGPVNWQERSHRMFPIRNQNGSLTCVCQTLATEMGIIFQQKYNEWIDFSSSFLYQQRGGSYGGCSSIDIYTIFPKLGNIFETIMPSQNMHEADILALERKNYYSDLALAFSIKRVELPVDFGTVASTIANTDKGVMVWFSSNYEEWTSTPFVSNSPLTFNHSVTEIGRASCRERV